MENPSNYASQYFATLARVAGGIAVTDAAQRTISLDAGIARFVDWCRTAAAAGSKLMFVGNGGSASIASHMAVDFSKNGRIKALAFNDPMFLTCLGNDLGFENVFAFQIETHAEPGDLLVAVSSSGRSANIHKAVAAARERRARVVSLSGFDDVNPLRALGDLNFYVPAAEYGYVELLHCSLCHCVLDALMGVKTD